MSATGRVLRFLAVLLVAPMAAAMGACAQEEAPPSLVNLPKAGGAQDGSVPDGRAVDASVESDSGGSAPGAVPPGACRQAHAQPIPVRLSVMSADAGASSGEVVTINDLLQRFQSVCGKCHSAQALGSFRIATPDDFQTQMTAVRLKRVTDDPPGPSGPMPPADQPNGMTPYKQRSSGDPVRQFAELVEAWLAASSPNSFTIMPASSSTPAPPGVDGGVADFTMTPANGNALTNIGNCVPGKALVGTNTAAMDALDAKFASFQRNPSSPNAYEKLGLPERLEETDLFTFDSHVLAKYGVVGYAPGYPLWSDNAGKLRYVRVPRSASIHFDKATQSFQIPDNTRFYKTFLKPVVEMDNSIRWKKVETRLIVARNNSPSDPDTDSPPSLFGTYQWNEAETEALLIQTPLYNGQPFADTVLQYVNDEALAAEVLLTKPALPEEALLEAKAARHYAIPSADRCRECHRGSPSRDFVLGFTPLQINRQTTGFHGVLEDAGPDELTQLQRFMDYGIVTGIDSLSDVLLLEQSQGARTPRNPYELVAQGYMLGNCAHCHNPHGDPSVQNPVLQTDLNFLPGPNGGIFQFPLEHFSRRIFRGAVTAIQIPYITPSLLDWPDDAASTLALHFIYGGDQGDGLFADKAAYAPWRSLIYRNVDNMFAYTDDLTLYPHMPRNTPGYDPRVKQIMSDWMVSIPAIRKRPDLDEYAFVTGIQNSLLSADDSPQPYVEVPPGAPGYESAKAAAQARLDILHTGVNPALPLRPSLVSTSVVTAYSRYLDQGETFDILDPAVLRNPICHSIPGPDPNHQEAPNLPAHAHWVITDLTQPAGDWAPRRPDWASILVDQKADTPPTNCGDVGALSAAQQDEHRAIGFLSSQPPIVLGKTCDQDSHSIRCFASTPIPYGVWGGSVAGVNSQPTPPDCATKLPTVGTCMSSGGAGACSPRSWMDPKVRAAQSAQAFPILPALPPNAHVYVQPPGAAVFKMICINCHGPLADSSGRMAQNLATMTGGKSIVANFRAGFQGPQSDPRAYMKSVFDVSKLPSDATAAQLAAWADPVTYEDRAARYLAWMALGGTQANVPLEILTLVGKTAVLGEQRRSALTGSANMLSNAKQICLSLIGPKDSEVAHDGTLPLDPTVGYFGFRNDKLIHANADAEMWMNLCTFNNPFPVVHMLSSGHVSKAWGADGNLADFYPYIRADAWTSADIARGKPAPVGNEWGKTVPMLDASNEWPWCDLSGSGPACPPELVANATKNGTDPSFLESIHMWAVRGAINAGLSVFVYLESLETKWAPDPDFDQCP
jgi:mono/diheme cytochrome c family protein